MENPFREVLDTKGESFSAKTKGIGQPLKNVMILPNEEGKEFSPLDYDFVFHQYQELHPHLCEEFEITDEMLEEFWNRQFGEE